MKELLEAGVHFGHQKRRWNPKMRKFIYTTRKNIHIIDLQKTLQYLKEACEVVRKAGEEGKIILYVGTKKQAVESIEENAKRAGMPYVNHRWLGGMLTNFKTIQKSIRKLEIIEEMEESGQLELLTKKERLILLRKKKKLERSIGGIRHMKRLPDFLFIIDTVREKNAVREAIKLGIPIIAPLDTNCDPDEVDYPIPANDDAIRSIKLLCTHITNAYLEGKALAEEGAIEEFGLDSEEEEAQRAEARQELEEEVRKEAAESTEEELEAKLKEEEEKEEEETVEEF